MNPSPVSGPASGASSRIQKFGIVTLAALSFALWHEPAPLIRLQASWFDLYQRIAPRNVVAFPTVIVAIDDKSIAALGQWPWPRTTLARLVREIARADPAVIGLDILMPEPDRLSAERLLDQIRQFDIEITTRVSTLPSTSRR